MKKLEQYNNFWKQWINLNNNDKFHVLFNYLNCNASIRRSDKEYTASINGNVHSRKYKTLSGAKRYIKRECEKRAQCQHK